MSADPISKAQRWLDLIAFLVGRRFPVTRREIYQMVPAYARDLAAAETEPESLRKKFLRDKSELEALGIVIETLELPGDDIESFGYRIRHGDFHLPYLKILEEAQAGGAAGPGRGAAGAGAAVEIAPEEASAALDGLRSLAELPEFPWRRDALSAWRKLSHDLVPAPDGEAAVTRVAPTEGADVIERLERLSAALDERRVCRFSYRAFNRDETSPRSVEPRGLLFKANRWYLIAWDQTREAMRTFRVGRMEGLEVEGGAAPQYAIPSDFSLEAWISAQPWDLPNEELESVPATVRFEFPLSILAERNELGELVSREDDGAQLRRFEVRHRDPFVRWLLTLEGDARVVEPSELVELWRERLERVLVAHAPDEEGA